MREGASQPARVSQPARASQPVRACPVRVGRCADQVLFPVGTGLSIPLCDLSISEAVCTLAEAIRTAEPPARTATVGFLNMRNHVAATESPALSETFSKIDYVFADGIGLQIGRMLLGLSRFQRISGTDLVPALLENVASTGCRVFLLGGTERLAKDAAAQLPALFPGVTISGYHHGYFDRSAESRLLDRINASRSDLLLIGMGTPRQELWLERNQANLNVRVAACVGGLFHYWAGDLRRSPRILIRGGFEWAGILLQQPYKWRIYTIDAARYLFSLVGKREPNSSDEPFF
jgi:exopolysaccharide biosynthesis WecB/TagA/CpsF family protein